MCRHLLDEYLQELEVWGGFRGWGAHPTPTRPSTHPAPLRLLMHFRRAFEKHFKEWRHQNGMRALGIPNNKNFYEVTQIEDALALWRNIQVRSEGTSTATWSR